jgi:predicted Rossmann-fold nucleotide-binding protein
MALWADRADALVAIGGGEGIVVEMMMAWGVKPSRPVVVLRGV